MSFFKRNKYPAHLQDELSVGKQAAIFVWEIVKVVVISLIIIIPIRQFVIKPFYVKGASMEPTFYDHEYLIINEFSYLIGAPQRGETVVLHDPFDYSQYFIKRVIGLPNERMKITDGKIYIFNSQNPDGKVLEEPYLPAGLQTLGSVEVTLGPDEYYVMGDNRLASLDSRVFGPVKRSSIIGKTMFRGWPINRVGLVTNELKYNL